MFRVQKNKPLFKNFSKCILDIMFSGSPRRFKCRVHALYFSTLYSSNLWKQNRLFVNHLLLQTLVLVLARPKVKDKCRIYSSSRLLRLLSIPPPDLKLNAPSSSHVDSSTIFFLFRTVFLVVFEDPFVFGYFSKIFSKEALV